MAVEQATREIRKRTYPHTDRIGDDASVQSFRLLWDQVYGLQERLTAAEQTITNLLSATDTLQTQMTDVQRAAREGLGPTQQVP